MRIISGQLKGLNLQEAHAVSAHPMSEKIRNALFNSLGSLVGKRLLDAFAGTGAIALEAYSRGCGLITAIEKDPQTYRLLKANLHRANADADIELIRANALTWSRRQEVKFDIIIADPPYGAIHSLSLEPLYERIAEKGLFVLSHPKDFSVVSAPTLKLLQTNSYSNAQLSYWRRIEA